MKVKFTDVGRNKASWEAECKNELTYHFLLKQVRSRGMINSRDIEFIDGHILAGMRLVGNYEFA